MDSFNGSVWKHYQPGFIDDLYVPYLRETTTDAWGNKVEINNWKEPMPPTMVQPELVRINRGLSFMKLFSTDPCPVGWVSDKQNLGYCVTEPLRHESVFYTDKAFIPQKQYFDGPAENGVVQRNGGYRRISEQTDMRSVNPLNGQYTVYYQPVQSSAPIRYVNPTPSDDMFDGSWNKARQGRYASMPSKDSLLA